MFGDHNQPEDLVRFLSSSPPMGFDLQTRSCQSLSEEDLRLRSMLLRSSFDQSLHDASSIQT